MTGTRGHFEKGEWVEEKIPDEAKKSDKKSMDARIEEVSAEVSGTMEKVVSLARDLFTTDEGKKHIQKKIDDAAHQLDSTFKDFISESEKALKQKKDEIKEEKKKIKVK